MDGTDESGKKRSDWGSIMAGIGDRPKTVGFWYEAQGKKSKQGLRLCLGPSNSVNDAEMEKTKIKAGLYQMLKKKKKRSS